MRAKMLAFGDAALSERWIEARHGRLVLRRALIRARARWQVGQQRDAKCEIALCPRRWTNAGSRLTGQLRC